MDREEPQQLYDNEECGYVVQEEQDGESSTTVGKGGPSNR